MAIANMHGFRSRYHTFAKGAGTAENEFISPEVKALHRKRVEGQKRLVVLFYQRQLLHKSRADIDFLKSGIDTLWIIY
jgi:hypothetical protein